VLDIFRDYLEGTHQHEERRAEENRRHLERRITLAVVVLTLAQVYGVAVTVITSAKTSWPTSLWPPSGSLHHLPPQWIALIPVLLLLGLGIGILLKAWRVLGFLVLLLLDCLPG